jgi:hypothetical protein
MIMRMFTGPIVALTFVGTIIGVAAVKPAGAQGVYIQGPGFALGIGRPAYRDRHYYRGYRNYGDAYAYSGKRYYRGHGIYPRRSLRWRHSYWD